MNYKMKILSVVMLSQAFIEMPLKAAALLEPLETASQAPKMHNSITPKEDLTLKRNIATFPSEDKSSASSYNNLKTSLLYSTKFLSGVASYVLAEQYLSHYTLPLSALKNAILFGAAVIGYTLPDMIEATTDHSQKASTSSEPFNELLKRNIKTTVTQASNYLVSLSIDEALAHIAYHGTLLWTGNPLLASASYQGAKNLTFYTGASHTFLKTVKDSGPRLVANSFSSVKNWWFKR
jgi:hypothetical protein